MQRGRTVPSRLSQEGSARAVFLAATSVAGPELVFLNTSGGLTGGDRLALSVELGAGCRVCATTQTAERAYRSAGGVAQMRVEHCVSEGGHLDWLPQETILYDASALERETQVSLGSGASCLLLETVVLGRAAMGETLRSIHLLDNRTIIRNGRPVMIEPVMLDQAALVAGPAVLAGARAFASVILVAQGAESAVDAVRGELVEAGVVGGASGVDGRLVVRLMAADGWPLRRQIVRLLRRLCPRPLPRVWQMAGGPA